MTSNDALRSRRPYCEEDTRRKSPSGAESPESRIAVLIVSWNSEDVIGECLSSVFDAFDHEGLAGEVIVVDNRSSDGTCEVVEQFGRATLIRNADNVGFARATNQAIAASTGEYALLMNPDARLTPGALTALLAALIDTHDAGCAGPAILDEEGTLSPFAARQFPSLRNAFTRQFLLGRILPALSHRETSGDAARDGARAVPCLTGAALLIPRRVLDKVGVLDERLPMYFEDLEFCARLEQRGLARLFVPEATVVHVGRASAVKSDRREFLMALEDGEAPWLYLRLFRGSVTAATFTCIVAVGSTFRLLALRALALVGRGAPHRPERLRAKALLAWSCRSKWGVLTEARADFQSGIGGESGVTSVLVHNLNRREMLRTCLDSVVSQTARPLEVVVLDAGSTDGSLDVIERAAKQMADNGIECRVVPCERLGVAASRNLAAAHATGDLLCAIDNDAAFTDCDDLRRVRDAFEAEPRLGVLSFQVLDHDSDDLDPKAWVFRRDPDTWRARQFDTFTFAGTGFCARTVAFRASGGFWDHLEYSREEEELALAMIDRGWRLRYAPQVAIRHYSATQGRMAWETRRFTELRNGILVLWRRFPIPIAAALIALRTASMSRNARREKVPVRSLIRAVPAAVREWRDDQLERQPLRFRSSLTYFLLNAERSS